MASLFDHTYAPTIRLFEENQAAARALGVEIVPLDVRTPADFALALETALLERADALLGGNDPLNLNQQARILEFTARYRLPAIYHDRSWVEAGGLMAYGPNTVAQYRRVGYYVDRILKGAKPADLPVEQPREFDFVLNAKTAQALGLTIPPHVLLQATEVIQ